MSTMKDVARVAGVSIATVSRVLAGTAAVTDSTQKKVLAAMEELQYRTAAPVRPVIRKESQLTAVCMENLTSPYYIDLLRADERITSLLSEEELTDCFRPEKSFTHIDEIYERLGLTE